MYNISLDNPVNIHFTGIGGISMSGLAEILHQRGFGISGSDMKESDITRDLSSRGMKISYVQDATAIPGDTDVLVYTAAVHEDHPELVAARERNIPLLTRAQLLGQIMRFYPLPVAISGTHGKTTTTSMLSEILLKAGVDPTLSIGGILPSIGGNIRAGAGDIFVTEACEYTDSFLSFFPKIASILNVEEDHLDYFSGLPAIINSFSRFAALLPADGLLIINGNANGIDEITKSCKCPVITFGARPALDFSGQTGGLSPQGDYDYSYQLRGLSPQGNPCLVITCKGYPDATLNLSVPGEHNALNAIAALAMADALFIDRKVSLKALSEFTGTKRRFEHKGSFNGVTVVDDYAHHPTEISAALKAAKDYPHRELWCVFQPHTYSRTKAFLQEFAAALSVADHLILQKIYPARETDDLGVSSRSIGEILEQQGKVVYYHDTFDDTCDFLKKTCHQGDMVITMGAGDVVNIGEMLLKN